MALTYHLIIQSDIMFCFCLSWGPVAHWHFDRKEPVACFSMYIKEYNNLSNI